ncbi:MAG: YXWGXW repeat-containing protein [Planctomycetes bacterium]|nr:YXWGXW repeat-containing protein [Planctomycetota bacterium]
MKTQALALAAVSVFLASNGCASTTYSPPSRILMGAVAGSQPAPQPIQPAAQGRPLSVADVKSLAKAGISEDIIISQVRASGSTYSLSAADIIDLRDAGVSNRTLDCMINAVGSGSSSSDVQVTQIAPPPQEQQVVYVSQQPPPPIVETVVIAPGPGYVWIGGEWCWNNRWSWRRGYWCRPPHPNSIWIGGSWGRSGSWHIGVGGGGPGGGHAGPGRGGPGGWEHRPGHWR